ncbi:hypothetical protein mRhiFer1_009370 [Rhinolophus ferrumequinum]|uniref:Uncharacterized protein n=1 Tax=Rhinolophus ferrumequinum TaxID=59479 RepID=A0A7J7RPM8_RHIFE|nr:hypothetical protein mRhiFer1_009370 [Rhinolophus ferrumequinum]
MYNLTHLSISLPAPPFLAPALFPSHPLSPHTPFAQQHFDRWSLDKSVYFPPLVGPLLMVSCLRKQKPLACEIHGEASRISVVENSSVPPEKFWCRRKLTGFGVLGVLSGAGLTASGCVGLGGEDNQMGGEGSFLGGQAKSYVWTNVFSFVHPGK